MYMYIYKYISLSIFCIECQILYNNLMGQVFKAVTFQILQIFNGLLECKKLDVPRIIRR